MNLSYSILDGVHMINNEIPRGFFFFLINMKFLEVNSTAKRNQ